MSNEFVIFPHLVRLRMPASHAGELGPIVLWAAATLRSEAVAAVKAAVPTAVEVELEGRALTKQDAARLKLRHGQVCEYSSGRP